MYRQRPPPLIIETYIDARELTANQTLVLLDDQGRRWNVDTAMSNKMDVVSGSRKAGRVNEVKPDVVLERWIVDLRYVSSFQCLRQCGYQNSFAEHLLLDREMMLSRSPSFQLHTSTVLSFSAVYTHMLV